jgi:GT2 family glycosyltransferase
MTTDFLKSLETEKKITLITLDHANTCNAKNMGIRAAAGEILLFLDDDVTIGEGFISAHVSNYADPSVGGVTGKVIIRNPNMDENIVFKNRLSLKYLIKKLFFFVFRKKAAYVGPYGVLADFEGPRKLQADTGIGCNLSFRKSVFNLAGDFDTNFIGNAYREETDMCFRVKKAGYRIIYEPAAWLFHYMNNTGGSRNYLDKKYWHNLFRNQCYFNIKCFNSPKFVIMFFFIFDILRCRKNGFNALGMFNVAFDEARSVYESRRRSLLDN